MHTFFICNEQNETNRFNSIQKQIKEIGIENYTIMSSTWSNDITPEIREKWVKSDISMQTHGRNWNDKPLNNGEISLVLNHLDCLQKIRRDYKEGTFVIFESDVILKPNYLDNLNTVISLMDDTIDCINIGNGHDSKPNPILSDDLSLYLININKCTEGILWTYKGVCRFLDEFEKTNDIDAPFDTKMDVFAHDHKFSIHWAHPPLVYQGSIRGMFQSFLR